MINLIKCNKCLTPETHEAISFDEQGVCNVCRQNEYKQEKIDWEKREEDLERILAEYRNKYDYDCIVPFSGGKDSTYILWVLVKKYRLKPLVVSYDHGFYRPTLEENKKRTFRKLGVDVLTFSTNWQIVKKLMLVSMKQTGDFCWHCHSGIFAYPMQVAIKYQVPLVIWGEPSAEYTSHYTYEQVEEVNEERFNQVTNLGINSADMLKLLDDPTVDERDLRPYAYPKLEDLMRLNYRSFCLGSYIPWDVKKQVEIIKSELDWREEEVEGVPPGYGYEKIECAMQGIRDYLKYIKRGYARTSHLTSIDIRNNRISRETAISLVNEYEGKRPASLEVFLDYVGISEKEFNEIALSQLIKPNECDPKILDKGNELWDQKLWYKENTPNKSIRELAIENQRLQKENIELKMKLQD